MRGGLQDRRVIAEESDADYFAVGTDVPLEAPAPSVAPADERTDTDTAATAEDTE